MPVFKSAGRPINDTGDCVERRSFTPNEYTSYSVSSVEWRQTWLPTPENVLPYRFDCYRCIIQMSRTNNKQTKAEHSEAYGIWHLAAAPLHSIVTVAWYLIDKNGLAKTRIKPTTQCSPNQRNNICCYWGCFYYMYYNISWHIVIVP